jgi:hypothetical protein
MCICRGNCKVPIAASSRQCIQATCPFNCASPFSMMRLNRPGNSDKECLCCIVEDQWCSPGMLTRGALQKWPELAGGGGDNMIFWKF